MARITLSPIITDIRGSIKGGLIFSNNQHGNMVYLNRPASRAASESQQVQRDAFAAAVSAWRDLSSDDQQSYHEAAAGLSIPSGYNLFLAEQLGGGSSGGVVVSQTLSATFYPDGSQDSERIPIGGQYGLNNFHYAFDVLARGTVLITVDGDADPIIWLDDGSGNQIASDDDGGSSLDSRLELLLEPGTYTLEVGVYWDRGIDETTLVLEVTGLVDNLQSVG